MFKIGKVGVATAAVLVIVVASIGGAMATPIIVDAAGADPDSPLYGLGRLGESMRMASDEEQMKNRWNEYSQMVSRGKGLEYSVILEEFNEKMKSVAPLDAEAKKEVVRWMQEQMPGMGLMEFQLANEFSSKFREFVENAPEYQERIDNIIRVLTDLGEQYSSATPEMQENILAQLRIIMDEFRMLTGRFGGRLPPELNHYFNADNLLMDSGIHLKIHDDRNKWMPGFENAPAFDNILEEFKVKLAEMQTGLEEIPENTPGLQIALDQLALAIELRDNAIVQNNAGEIEKASFILRAAFAHLDSANRILRQTNEWWPGFQPEWMHPGRPDFPPFPGPWDQQEWGSQGGT